MEPRHQESRLANLASISQNDRLLIRRIRYAFGGSRRMNMMQSDTDDVPEIDHVQRGYALVAEGDLDGALREFAEATVLTTWS